MEQRRIGWKLFLEGVLTSQWKHYMKQYYSEKNSMKSSTQWGNRLYKHLWNFTFAIWEGRNKQLHETKHIEDMEGIEILKQSIQKEYDKGLGRLPASEFSHLFRTRCNDLLQKPLDILMNWFLIIRQARILLDTDHLITDEFSTSRALQGWIGLSYSISDNEGREMLQEAIKEEIATGLGNLPQSYQQYFVQLQQDITKTSTSQLKTLFKAIRTGRQLHDLNNYTQDEFTNPGAYRDWVGL